MSSHTGDQAAELREAVLALVRHNVHSARVALSHDGGGCHLTVDEFGAALDGAPNDLRGLATRLGTGDSAVSVRLSTGGIVRRHLTDDSRLLVAVEPGPVLVIAGDATAVNLVVEALQVVADSADEIHAAAVCRHTHIEYLGEDDRWRSPDSFPLVIGSEWPDQ